MRLFVTLMLITASLFAVSQTKDKQEEAKSSVSDASGDHPFVGTWHAEFKGKTFLTIKLEKQQDKLTGTASHFDVRLDDSGELASAEEGDGEAIPITEARLTNGILRITLKEEESQEMIQFEMKLAGTDQAELRMLVPPDVPKPKPWKLLRAKDAQ
jgi:hypothetical protein